MADRHRIMLVVAYDGTNYSGYAAQKDPEVRTIEGTINEALSDLTGEEIHVIGASRTDAGVHALCNYLVFDTESRIPPNKFEAALNTRLPEDIRVRTSKEVSPDFSPRGAKSIKTYEYRIYASRVANPMKTRYAYHTYFPMRVDRMREAAAYLVGEHDFKSFANVRTTAETTVREVLGIEIEESFEPMPTIMLSDKKHQEPEQDKARDIVIRVTGRGFLYNMVRIIAGTLMEVGRGLRTPEQVKEMLDAKDRTAAGPTAPAQGLTLVNYKIEKIESNKKDMEGRDL